MKCRLNYEIDGEPDYFDVVDGDAEKCRIMVNSEVERLGLEQVKNNIKIDVVFDNRRDASFLGIPCWYYAESNDVEGRTVFYDLLFNTACVVVGVISSVSLFVTGKPVQFALKVKGVQ